MVIGIMAARNFAHLKKKIIGKLEKMIIYKQMFIELLGKYRNRFLLRYVCGMLLTYIFAKLFLTGISKSIKEVCILQIKVDFESR